MNICYSQVTSEWMLLLVSVMRHGTAKCVECYDGIMPKIYPICIGSLIPLVQIKVTKMFDPHCRHRRAVRNYANLSALF